ncbi:MAG TPA: hypothetical protein VIX59_01015 [Candidatus Binataceae bacterium]
MKPLVMLGAILALLGLVGIAVPVFTTQQTKDVAKLGDLKLQANENTTHVIPPLVSEGALLIGVVMIGAGIFVRQ